MQKAETKPRGHASPPGRARKQRMAVVSSDSEGDDNFDDDDEGSLGNALHLGQAELEALEEELAAEEDRLQV